MMKYLSFFLFFLSSTSSWANLRFYPTRVLLSTKQRSSTIEIKTLESTPRAYHIETIYYEMDHDGNMKESKTVPSNSAGDLIFFSPKSFTISPGQSQIIRIKAVPARAISDGTYRTHLKFIPDEDEGLKKNDTVNNNKKLAVELKLQLSIAIPVYFNYGQSNVKVELSNFSVIPGVDDKALKLDIEQNGNSFAYGDFFIEYLHDPSATPIEIGRLKGAASYVPKRSISIPFYPNKFPTKDPKIGSLKISLFRPEEEGKTLLTEKTLSLKDLPITK